jgi:UDP-N-acetyl-D-glucosamine dehydrogenase
LESLLSKIVSGDALVGVIGLGYVGLPLARAFWARGNKVLGFDVDVAKVEALNAKRSYLDSIPDALIAEATERGLFSAHSDFAELARADAILICVPTPLTRHREPDMSYIDGTIETIAAHLRPGQLVVLESTTYPGTTRERVVPRLERTGLKAGQDFFVAFSPEREDPGNRSFRTDSIPKVVGADDPVSQRLATALYERAIDRVVGVSTLATAEAVKLTENIFRSVNIALVNELKVIYSAMGIDIWEVIEAAKTKPFGYMPFYPGPGLGGHCIPIDPFYLTWKARELEISTRFIELAGEINTQMPGWVVERLAEALDRSGRPLFGARVLLLGIAYKKNIADDRESPAYKLMQILARRGAEIAYHDPHVPEIRPSRHFAEFAGMRSVDLDPAAIAGFDAVLICTDHDAVDYAAIVAHAKLVVDTRNATRGIEGPAVIVRA